ncbi:hypothetical protein [Effusibacillus pohliae]|uniref:hypothetical protein n=1 Tax=Effusibacillus pohliae TaxID=232270 RepID=UPI000363D45E|nr:hypothetical protein [Effusibacillus pohliae]
MRCKDADLSLTERELAREKAFEQLLARALAIGQERGIPISVDLLINEARKLAKCGCDWCEI